MRPLVLALVVAAIAASNCSVCEHDDAADGQYNVVSDCAGQGLITGIVVIGSKTSATRGAVNCSDVSPDASHPADLPGDAGVLADAGTAAGTCSDTLTFAVTCGETTARGTSELGLPSTVKVRGTRDFALTGDYAGRTLSCEPEGFGDAKILFCRDAGRIVCAAVVRNL